ncbi:MAG: IclR family transcriptional regulator [Rubrivivax sp.]|nr:IclR family transcriptional regulator [Rubrivivax sp.]
MSGNPEPIGSLQRASALLRLLANAGQRGAGLTDLAKEVRLPHPSVHRLLRQLIAEGLARQIEGTRRYALGSLAFELGLAAAQQFDIRGLCRPALDRLALDAGDTAYLVVRSGDEAVCIDLEEGPSPIRVLTLQIGSRRPLGVGAGGLAILAALDEPERGQVLGRCQDALDREWQLPAALLDSSMAAAASAGHVLVRNRVTLGVSAIGQAFRDALGRPIGAISVAATNDRMADARVRTLAGLLARSVRQIERALRAPRH